MSNLDPELKAILTSIYMEVSMTTDILSRLAIKQRVPLPQGFDQMQTSRALTLDALFGESLIRAGREPKFGPI